MKWKRFIPGIFKSEKHLREIQGVYVPFWLFTTDVSANFEFTAIQKSEDESTYKKQKYTLKRKGEISFDHLPIDAARDIPNEMIEAIEPFNFKEAVDFQEAYITGYFLNEYTEHYDVGIERANEKIKKETELSFKSSVADYQILRTNISEMVLENSSVSYALYPMWIYNTVWRGKLYRHAINGQTGTFVGDFPVNRGAGFLWFLLWTGVISLLIFILAFFIFLR